MRFRACLGELLVTVTYPRVLPRLGADLPGERHAALGQIALDDLVDQAALERFGGADHGACGNHVQGCVDTHQARQPLGSAGAGDDAEVDFGEAKTGRPDCHAIVTGQRQLKAATERCAMNRRDDGPAAHLDGVEALMERRRLRRLVEFADVGAGHERPASTHQDDRACILISDCVSKRCQQPFAHRVAERINRGVIDADDCHVAAALQGNDVVYFRLHVFANLSVVQQTAPCRAWMMSSPIRAHRCRAKVKRRNAFAKSARKCVSSSAYGTTNPRSSGSWINV